MAWIWGGWAAFAIAVVAVAIGMERSMIVGRIDGANGLTLFMSMVLIAVGGTVVVVLTWLLRDVRAAAIVAVIAVAAQWLAWQVSLRLVAAAEASRRRER